MKTKSLICVIGFALAVTPVAAGQQFVEACRGTYCYQSFIEKSSPTRAGLFAVKIKNLGFDSATKEKLTDYRWFVVSCDKAAPYVSSGRERIDVAPDATSGALRSVHVTQDADRLWKAVCGKHAN